MILFDNVNRSLQVVLGGAITTNQLPIVACYADITQATMAAAAASANTTATNSTTPVTVVAAPASGVTRQLKYLSVFNADTVAATVLVQYNDNATLLQITWITLQPNEMLFFDQENSWQVLTVGGGVKLGGATGGAVYKSGAQSPTAPNSTTTYKMQGLAGSITPVTTGNIFVSISGTVTAASATTVDIGVLLQGSYGTGSAPGSNAALTGTQIGAIQEYTWPVAPTAVGDVHYGFNVTFIIQSATLNTAYWLDLAAKAVTTASDAPLVGVVIHAFEF